MKHPIFAIVCRRVENGKFYERISVKCPLCKTTHSGNTFRETSRVRLTCPSCRAKLEEYGPITFPPEDWIEMYERYLRKGGKKSIERYCAHINLMLGCIIDAYVHGSECREEASYRWHVNCGEGRKEMGRLFHSADEVNGIT